MVKNLDSLPLHLEEVMHQQPDLLEIRLDAIEYLDFDKFKEIIDKLTIPYILSVRSEWYKQELKPPDEGRIPFIKKMITLKPPYLSFEYPMDISLIKYVEESTIPIIALVDFEGIAKIAFNSSIQIMEKHTNAILKISAFPNNTTDLLTLWRWGKILTKKEIKHVIIGMGQMGTITRVKSRELGNLWTYGRLNVQLEEPEYPGMIPLHYLKNIDNQVHLLGINNGIETPVRIILDQLTHKIEPQIIYIDQNISHLPEVNHLLMLVRDYKFKGAYINVPWNSDIIEMLDIKDHSVVYTNQCNVIVKINGDLKGYNSRVNAIETLLDPHMDSIRKVYIEGVDYDVLSYLTALRKYDLDYIVIRTSEQGVVDMLKQINPRVISEHDAYFETYDLFINCHLPYPGFENVLPVSEKIINSCKLVIDQLSSANNQSAIEKHVIQRGGNIISGWQVYIQSLFSALEIWIGIEIIEDYTMNIDHLEGLFDPEIHFA